jgi:hypothetical protein
MMQIPVIKFQQLNLDSESYAGWSPSLAGFTDKRTTMKRIHWKAEGSSLSDCSGSQDTLRIESPCPELRYHTHTKEVSPPPHPPKHDHHPLFISRKRKEIYPRSQEIRVLEPEGRLLQGPSKWVLLTTKLLKGKVLENRHYCYLYNSTAFYHIMRLPHRPPYTDNSNCASGIRSSTHLFCQI